MNEPVATPVPRDPRQPVIDVAALAAAVQPLLAAEPASLREAHELYSQAHDILQAALR
ncbi:hypothetical protein ACFPVT_05335 [Corynebacterium choanae]|uniref:Uncharacterized protein n=1 Tax=Corynebacterium choanae TaxID=1862358 RepID=A0A3G6J6N9_9CORY|nr:hypothetical protein [Corynebacterium choanae]AZA13482.1 hypothetical protein CCHOA_05405 [Corynebacterium choanae]